MIVPIVRGGNLGGAAWQRAQLARNRFSPSSRMVSSCAASLDEVAAVAVAAAGAGVLFLLLGVLAHADATASPINMARIARAKGLRVLNFIADLPSGRAA